MNLLCRYLEGCQCTVIIDLLARSPTVTVALLHIDLMLHIPGQGLKLSKYSELVIYFSWSTIKILQNILVIRLYVNIFKSNNQMIKNYVSNTIISGQCIMIWIFIMLNRVSPCMGKSASSAVMLWLSSKSQHVIDWTIFP